MRLILIVSLLLGALLPGAELGAQTAPAYKVIVHPKNPVASLGKREVASMFLKKTTAWKGGAAIQPVDQTASSSARETFSRAVHGKSAKAMKQYWNQQIYAGKGVPPPEVAGDAKVVAFVLANPGAIGYVSADANVGEARVVTVD